MISAYNATLEKRPERFNRISVDVAADILATRMIDRFVMNATSKMIVRRVLISRYERNLIADHAAHEARQGSSILIANDATDYIAFASNRADNADLAVTVLVIAEFQVAALCADLSAFLVPMAIAVLAANVSLISLNFSRHRERIAAHGSTNAMAHEPGGFIAASSKHPMDLKGAHAFLGMEHQEDDLKPSPQLDVRILKDSPSQNAKPIAILGAYKDFASLFIDALSATLTNVMEWASFQRERLAIAARTLNDAIRPTLAL
jgi:hypothetical protein